MNILKNRTVLGAVCVILALLLCFCIAPLLAGSGGKKVEIVRAKTDIPQGTLITHEMLEKAIVNSYSSDDGVFTQSDDVAGKYAAVNMTKNRPVYAEQLSETQSGGYDYLKRLDGDKLAISISVTFAGGVSAKPQAGDVITIIAVDSEKAEVPETLRYVEILAVTASSGLDVEAPSEAVVTSEDEEPAEPELPDTMTLIVTPKQAIELAYLESNSTIHAALACVSTNPKAAILLAQQAEYLANMPPEVENNG